MDSGFSRILYFRHLIFLSKSLDLLALNIYRFLLFSFQRDAFVSRLVLPIRPLPFGRTHQARRAYTRVGVRCQDFFLIFFEDVRIARLYLDLDIETFHGTSLLGPGDGDTQTARETR